MLMKQNPVLVEKNNKNIAARILEKNWRVYSHAQKDILLYS